jgi:hypothetical protein
MQGVPVYLDGTLPHLYYSTKAEGNIKNAFCGQDKNLGQFVSYFENLKTMQVCCEVAVGGKLIPVGFTWIVNPAGVDGARLAQPGMCFFGGAGKRGTAQSLAKLALAYAMVDLRINFLLGEQVYSNYAARNFALRLGFKEVARIPNRHVIDGRFEDGRVVMLKDEDFLPGFYQWKEKQPKMS